MGCMRVLHHDERERTRRRFLCARLSLVGASPDESSCGAPPYREIRHTIARRPMHIIIYIIKKEEETPSRRAAHTSGSTISCVWRCVSCDHVAERDSTV